MVQYIIISIIFFYNIFRGSNFSGETKLPMQCILDKIPYIAIYIRYQVFEMLNCPTIVFMV